MHKVGLRKVREDIGENGGEAPAEDGDELLGEKLHEYRGEQEPESTAAILQDAEPVETYY